MTTALLGAVAATLIEMLRIVREALVIPAQIWLAAAEVAGAAVLEAWWALVRAALAVHRRALRAVRWAQEHVRPAYGVAAVCIAAAAALLVAQFMHYRGVSVGAPGYAEVGAVAPAPEVVRERTGAAHAWLPIPIALAAVAATVIALRGRWRVARLLVPLGLAAVAISVLDAIGGLDAGAAAVAYEGAQSTLLEGFWTQLVAGAVLACGGLLLSSRLRPPRARSRTRSARPPTIADGSAGTEGAKP